MAMTSTFPYAYISCPCSSGTDTETSDVTASSLRTHHIKQDDPRQDDEDQPLNPHSPRANFSLLPYEELLFCDECHQIRCPRCWADEITNWYCPSCLFDVPTSIIRAEGNRCNRNCYNCPLCTASLSINALGQANDQLAPQDTSQPSGPFFLSCPYCQWSSLDVGIEFSKPNKITEQIARLRKRRATGGDGVDGDSHDRSVGSQPASTDAAFSNLLTFYRSQLQESDTARDDSSYNSPGNLTRIMQLYGGLSSTALKKSMEKPQPMREALNAAEGLFVISQDRDKAVATRCRSQGLLGTTTAEQRSSHPWNNDARFTSDLWPVATLLRTRRSKRCRACRHILTRLEERKTSSGGTAIKYKIRLLAQAHLPRLSLAVFTPGISPSSIGPDPRTFALTPAALETAREDRTWDLQPLKPIQYLLTLTNPLFEPVKVTLATPSITPGHVKSRVTILCPTFDIGADGDMWDEALSSSTPGLDPSSTRLRGTSGKDAAGSEDRQPEAGKVWERGRNWTSVVLEVVPGSVASARQALASDPSRKRTDTDGDDIDLAIRNGLRDGDENLEIPIFVRVEWEADATADQLGHDTAAGSKPAKESREVAFWAVLGAGRITG